MSLNDSIINKSEETSDTDIYFQDKNINYDDYEENIDSNEAPIEANIVSGTKIVEDVDTSDIDDLLNSINNINKPILAKKEQEAKEAEEKRNREIEEEIQKRKELLLKEKAEKEAEEREKIRLQEEEELRLLEEEKQNKKKKTTKASKDKSNSVVIEDTKEVIKNISDKAKEIPDNIKDTLNDFQHSAEDIKEEIPKVVEEKIDNKKEKVTIKDKNKSVEIKEDNKNKEEKKERQQKEEKKKTEFSVRNLLKKGTIDKNKDKENINNNKPKEDEQKVASKEEIQNKDNINWKEKATHDELTGLKNNVAYEEDIKQFDTNGCILFADANNLKYVNDNIGHSAGDTLLIEISKVFSKYFENIYRMGGDEFIILTTEKEDSVKKKINNINKKLESITKSDKSGIIYSVAIGYAYGDGEKSIQDIRDEADSNMYNIKQEYKKAHPELNVREAKKVNNEEKDWKSLAMIDQSTKLYNKLALNMEKITKTDNIVLLRIANFKDLTRAESEKQTKILSDIIRISIDDKSKAFFIDNGEFLLINKQKKDTLEKIKIKTRALSLGTEMSSITGLDENIDKIIEILEDKLKVPKNDEPKTYDEKLTVAQRKLKENIKNNHEIVKEEDFDNMLGMIQRKSSEIMSIFMTSKDFNSLFIFFDVYDFLDNIYEIQDEIDFSYIYAVFPGGALYYGADEYSNEINDLFQKIASELQNGNVISPKDIQKIPGINIFENIYLS